MINYKRLNDLERECVHTYGGFSTGMPKYGHMCTKLPNNALEERLR